MNFTKLPHIEQRMCRGIFFVLYVGCAATTSTPRDAHFARSAFSILGKFGELSQYRKNPKAFGFTNSFGSVKLPIQLS